jgi:hypothetical protein
MDSLDDLPVDELLHLAGDLGLRVDREAEPGELLRLIRERKSMIEQLDRDVLLELIAWTRIPVKRSTPAEQLVHEICSVDKMNFDGLTRSALAALARIRGLQVAQTDDEPALKRRLHKAEGVGNWWHRKARRLLAKTLSGLTDDQGPYRFVPEDRPVPRRLDQEIQRKGLVGGIGSAVRGAADQYVAEELDEIEARIDRKLEDIDHRLAEWRDREIANRLKIIRITLIISVIISAVSLAYAWLHRLIVS